MPKFSEPGGVTLLPMLHRVLVGWSICGEPVRVAVGLSTVALPVPGLYESRQAWLDREGITGGLRRVYEACWALADAELQSDYNERIEKAMKKKD